MTNYKNLEAWKKAMLLVKDIYALVKQYPKEELFALTSKTKRAMVSIPVNIAEGIGKSFKKDTIQFLHIARGSLYEVETLLNIAVWSKLFQRQSFCIFLINRRAYENYQWIDQCV